MYICDNCQSVFSEWDEVADESEEYGDGTIIRCPHCGEEVGNSYEYEADDCPVCHGWKNKDDRICRKCALSARGRFLGHLRDGYTLEELRWITEQLEGDTLDEAMLRGRFIGDEVANE